MRRVVAPANVVAQAAWRARGARANRRTALLYAVNGLMLDHLLDFAGAFAEDTRMGFVVAWPIGSPASVAAEVRRRSRREGMPCVPAWRALVRQRCDLIVVADPHLSPHTQAWMLPHIPKVYIGHQISRGKTIGAGGYRYNESVPASRGDELFACIFESSEANRQAAIQTNPALGQIVRTVGNLRADRLLTLAHRRAELRASRGLTDNEVVVFVQSTWNSASLMEAWGAGIVAEAEHLTADPGWRFIFSTHPNHWTGPWAAEHPWGQYLITHSSTSLRVVAPETGAEEDMVVSDVIVTDHTSQAVMASLLGVPMIFARTSEVPLVNGSPVWLLRETLPAITSPDQLRSGVQAAMLAFDAAAHAAMTEAFLSCRGHAATRVRSEIYSLMGLSVPTDSADDEDSPAR